MKRLTMMLLGLMAVVMGMKAQVGYQIALLNTATGEARANETVTVSVTLSNSEGTAFYSETKQATTNDFGVLSLTIGNADTFANVDFSKMPFFIEVSANGTLIGKSQILSVPVAEAAKRLAPIDINMLVGTWKGVSLQRNFYGDKYQFNLILNKDKTATYNEYLYYDSGNQSHRSYSGKFDIEGNHLYFYFSLIEGGGEGAGVPKLVSFRYWNGKIYTDNQSIYSYLIDYFEK